MSDLRGQIRDLSSAEKFDLLDVLWESIEADEVTLSDSQRNELNYRLDQYNRNPDDVIAWEQVRAGLLKKH